MATDVTGEGAETYWRTKISEEIRDRADLVESEASPAGRAMLSAYRAVANEIADKVEQMSTPIASEPEPSEPRLRLQDCYGRIWTQVRWTRFYEYVDNGFPRRMYIDQVGSLYGPLKTIESLP